MILWMDKSEFSEADIRRLVDDGEYEKPTLEFKSDFQEKKGGASEWKQGKQNISGYPRDRLLEEIVAFANTDGGFVVLGIEEDGEHPPRATGISPLPDIHKLAEYLNDMCGSVIDPPIVGLQIFPIVIGGQDSGVIVVKVPRSRSAPHRLSSNRHVFVRRHLSCQCLDSMREVQDLVIRQHKQKYEAVWAVIFRTQGGGENGGVLTMVNGRLFGGDSSFYYKGYYEQIGDFLFVSLTVNFYHGDNVTAWGDRQNKIALTAVGILQDEKKIEGKLTRLNGSFPQLDFILHRVDELPE